MPADNALRQLARWMTTEARLDAIAAIRRDDMEDYKLWLAGQAAPEPAGEGSTTIHVRRCAECQG